MRNKDALYELYQDHLRKDPPQDAGGHPSMDVHDVVGAAWAEWERQRVLLRSMLAEVLVREYLEEK